MKIVSTILAILLISSVMAFTDDRLERLLSMPAKKKESYAFNPASSLISRLAAAPGFVYEYLTNMDEVTNYLIYLPDGNETRMIARYLDLLPPLNKKVLKERMLGVYFIENFLGSGMADFVLDKDTNFYFIIVLNRAVLHRSLTEQFTYRERTCFKTDNPSWTLSVDCGTNETGLLYILLHESTHAVDYVMNVTPYVETASIRYMRSVPKDTGFTRNVWVSVDVPNAGFNFPGRGDITFYGFNKGPRIRITDAPKIYNGLVQSGFISLYGSQNWAEDLAEMVTFYTITERMKVPCRVIITSNGAPVGTWEPAKAGKVAARFKTLEMFFK